MTNQTGFYSKKGTEPCPECGCAFIGTDMVYATGLAMFCQDCGHRGPRVVIDDSDEDWRPATEAEAICQWNEQAQAKKLKALDGGYGEWNVPV